MAEGSKALRSGHSLFGGVGSNPTLTSFPLPLRDLIVCALWCCRGTQPWSNGQDSGLPSQRPGFDSRRLQVLACSCADASSGSVV